MNSRVTTLSTSSHDQADLALHVERLIPAVESILRSHSSITEHQLIKILQAPPWRLLGKVVFSDPASLYPVHFLLFHVLYRLRDELVAESQETLHISPLEIQITAIHSAGDSQVGESDPLSEFYRNLDNLTLSREAIEQMMDDFWRGQAGMSAGGSSEGSLQEACAVLEVPCPPENYKNTKQQFRRLAMQRHPDRGGSNRELQALNQAMAVIRQYFRKVARSA
ncbi:DNA-J related domain-containing protein [Marinobacteraceae bacterium S3BR75-40.1]